MSGSAWQVLCVIRTLSLSPAPPLTCFRLEPQRRRESKKRLVSGWRGSYRPPACSWQDIPSTPPVTNAPGTRSITPRATKRE